MGKNDSASVAGKGPSGHKKNKQGFPLLHHRGGVRVCRINSNGHDSWASSSLLGESHLAWLPLCHFAAVRIVEPVFRLSGSSKKELVLLEIYLFSCFMPSTSYLEGLVLQLAYT